MSFFCSLIKPFGGVEERMIWKVNIELIYVTKALVESLIFSL
jgi:hypothetical protein